MDKAGDLLRQQRLKLKLTFTQVSKLTKIPVTTLQALEKNHYQRLPGPTYIKGFIQNYAGLLRLKPEPLLALFRRDYDKIMQKKILPSGLTKPLNTGFNLNFNKNILALGAALFGVALYLSWSIYGLYQPPQLIIFQPENGVEVTNPVLIKGETDHDATVTVNGKTVNLEPDGSFTTAYQGVPGTVALTIEARSRRERATTVTRHVIIGE